MEGKRRQPGKNRAASKALDASFEFRLWKDCAMVAMIRPGAVVGSEVVDYPHIRLRTRAQDREMTPVGGGKPPYELRLWLLPNRLGITVEVNMQQGSGSRFHG
jgi:hypothetical protein